MVLLSNGTKIKLLWYLLLSTIGVFHAEVLSWSSPDVLYNPFNFLLITPVYAVHYVLFGDLIRRYGRGNHKVLYVFGCLTGMYETFITKVYWSPPWNPEGAGPLGVAWLELLWIGFTWHAFMSFLIPFRLMDGLFSPGNGKPFRARDLRAVLLVTPAMGAVLGYGFGFTLESMLPSVLLSLLVITLLAVTFMKGARRWGFTSPDQLAFGRRGRWLAVGFFSSVYIGYGIFLRPEFLPLGLPLVPILLIYAGLVYLAVTLLRSSREARPVTSLHVLTPGVSLRYLLLYVLAFGAFFLAFGGVNALAPSVLQVGALVLMIAGAGLPVVLLSIIAARTLKARGRGRRAAEHL